MFEQVEFTAAETSSRGLTPARLTDLGPLVILVGKNGSGKSRYLKLLPEALARGNQRASLEFQRDQAPPDPVDPSEAGLPMRPPRYRSYFERELQNLPRTTLRNGDSALVEVRTGEMMTRQPQSWSPPQFSQLINLVSNESTFNVEDCFWGMTNYVAGNALAFYFSQHPEHANDQRFLKGRARAETFNQLLESLLGTRVGYVMRDDGPVPQIFGRDFVPSELSPGQRTLLAWAIAIHSQTRGQELNRNAVISVDEPELHLHPAGYIDVLRRVWAGLIANTDRQLWLATHSASVLAHFGPDADVFLVEGGAIRRASKHIAKAMDELLGGDKGREQLAAFLSDARSTEFAGFAAQALRDAMVSARTDEQQSSQLCKMVREANGAPLRLLDYAAGRGRFARALSDDRQGLAEGLQYFAFDHPDHDKHRDERVRNIRKLHDDADVRASADITAFKFENRVNVVVMCNFLHEVPASKWREHLEHARDVLTDDGVLVIMEDLRISVGELPHHAGFIVLGLAELRVLLGSSLGVESHTMAHDRCSMVTVTCSVLVAALAQEDWTARLKATLQAVRARALEDVRAARAGRGSGIDHARASIELANADISLAELGARVV